MEICSITGVFVTINVPNINKANITGDSLGFYESDFQTVISVNSVKARYSRTKWKALLLLV